MNTKSPVRGKTNVSERLAKIAKDIKVFEKRTIANVIAIGRLLYEASETCEHGEYSNWLAKEFGWSDQTALNYRNVFYLDKSLPYATSEKPNNLAFKSVVELNITLTALYWVAGMKRDEHQGARLEILTTAKRERVTFSRAQQIFERFILEETADDITDDEDDLASQSEKTERKLPTLNKAKVDSQLAAIRLGIIETQKLIDPYIDGLSDDWVNVKAHEIQSLIHQLTRLLNRFSENQRTLQGLFHVITDPTQH